VHFSLHDRCLTHGFVCGFCNQTRIDRCICLFGFCEFSGFFVYVIISLVNCTYLLIPWPSFRHQPMLHDLGHMESLCRMVCLFTSRLNAVYKIVLFGNRSSVILKSTAGENLTRDLLIASLSSALNTVLLENSESKRYFGPDDMQFVKN